SGSGGPEALIWLWPMAPSAKGINKCELFDRAPGQDSHSNPLLPRVPPTITQELGYSSGTQSPPKKGGLIWCPPPDALSACAPRPACSQPATNLQVEKSAKALQNLLDRVSAGA